MSGPLQFHGLNYTRLFCPPLSPGVCSNSCPLRWWCYLIISSSIAPFSFCLQSFPASGSFPMSWLFSSGGQSIGASASVLLMDIQGWFPLGLTGLITLAVQETLKGFLQHHNSKASILQCSTFFMVHTLYMITGENHSSDYTDFVGKVMSLLFNTLSRFVIAFFQKASIF